MPSDRDTAPAAVEVSEAAWKVVKDTIAELQQLSQRTDGYASGYAWQEVIQEHLLAARSAAEAERDALRDRVKVLEEALRPFAHVAQSFPFQPGTTERRERNKVDGIVWSYRDGDTDYRLHVPDFRRAHAALSQNRTEGGTP